MGCFGDMEPVKTVNTSSSTTLPSWMTAASQGNVERATDVSERPYTPYTGEMVAPLTQNQTDAFSLIKSIANAPNRYLSDIENLYKSFASAPAGSVTPTSMLGGGRTVSNTTLMDYMSPYVMAALQPRLEDLSRTGVAQRQGLDSQAAMDGAFGDARSGFALAEQLRNEAAARSGVVGQGYQSAFDRAAALRGQDITNDLNAQGTNASLMETMLQRMLSGGNALNNLDTAALTRGLTSADALAKAGATEQQTNQALDTARMNDFLRSQGWDQQQISWLTSILSGSPTNKYSTGTQVTSEPDNSGWGAVGSLVGAVAPKLLTAIISDRRLKTDISVIGATLDGLPIYRFKYLGGSEWLIGLMADDVEAVMPTAIVDVNGIKAVNYGMATETAAKMGATV